MAETSTTLDPAARLAIEEDSRVAGGGEVTYPVPPGGGEAFGLKNLIQGQPAYGVKRLPEIKLEDNSRSLPFVTGLDNVRRIDEILRDAAALYKTRLVIVD